MKGEGNDYITLYRHLDPRIGRWMSIDPKSTAFESPYASMRNNPILYNDVKGDTISYRGNQKDTEKIIKTYSDQLGKNNLKLNRIYDKKGNLSGADIVEATKSISSKGSKSLNRELIDVINSKENIRIIKVITDPNKADYIETEGGAYSNGPKHSIYVSDTFFNNGTDIGKYSYIEKSHHWFVPDKTVFRPIPFNEALFHETIHQAFGLRKLNFDNDINREHNQIYRILNEWRVEHNIYEQGYLIFHIPTPIFGPLMGDYPHYKEESIEYDDYINETNTQGIYNPGEKRTDVKTPHKN